MFTAKDIVTLYWANIKSAYQASFSLTRMFVNAAPRTYLPVVSYFFALITVVMECLYLLLNIITFQVVKTMIDLFTRKPLSDDGLQTLQTSCDALRNKSSDEVNDFITGIIQLRNLHQSQNSIDLISTLSFLNSEKTVSRCIDIPENEQFRELGAGITEEDFLNDPGFEYRPLNEDQKNVNTAKKLDAIKAYIQNPENNGTKLMQYLQTNLSDLMINNLSDLMTNKQYRAAKLKVKAGMEILRLELEDTSSSRNKASEIKKAMSVDASGPYDEMKLRKSLLIHRGRFGFHKPMPDSFTHVFCTSANTNDTSIKTYLNFLNPLSTDSGFKIPKDAKPKPLEGADKIRDLTVVENTRFLYERSIKEGLDSARDGLMNPTPITFFYEALAGNHYEWYQKFPDKYKVDGVGGICAKGILDFLIFPLVARKLLFEINLFIDNDENYRWNGTLDDLAKGVCWVGLIPSVALALSLEIIRLSLAVTGTVLSVFATMIAVAAIEVTAPIWFPIFLIYKCCSDTAAVEGREEQHNNNVMTSSLV